MKKIFLSFLIIVCSMTTTAQQPGTVSTGILKPSATEDSIRNTALDYAEGYYSGDGERMSKAIHPDLNKAFPRFLPRTGQVVLTYSTYSGLVEISSAKLGFLTDSARHIQVNILYLTPNIAMVKVNSAKFNDYLQIVRINGEWKIINVLWNSPQNASWTKEFKQEKEKRDLGTAVSAYIRGTQACDAEQLQEFVSPDFTRVSVVPIGNDGRSAVQRLRFESLEKSAMAGAGRQEETQRDNTIEILDIMDGMAMVRIQTIRNVEYLQMYRDSDHWKLFNCLSTPRPDQKLADLLPAIAGEPMPEFSLPVYGGGEFSLAAQRGKNVLLMFPRGWVGNSWCAFCPYQYLELAELEKKEQWQKKYNVEVVFVMPYSQERIADWFAKFPENMKTLEGIKNPQGGPVPGIQGEFSLWTRNHFPMTFDFADGVPSKAFPVLCDEKRILSKRLKLFTEFWDNAQSEQNVAAIYLIDKEGILRWKYISQMTEDRPSTIHMMKIIKDILH